MLGGGGGRSLTGGGRPAGGRLGLGRLAGARSLSPTPQGRALGSLLGGAIRSLSPGRDRSHSPSRGGERRQSWKGGPTYSTPSYGGYGWGGAPYYGYGGYDGPYTGYGSFYQPQFVSPFAWFPGAYYGLAPFQTVYNPLLGYTTIDASLWSPAIAQLLQPSQSPEISQLQQQASVQAENTQLVSVFNFTSLPFDVRLASSATGQDVVQELSGTNNALVVPLDLSAPITVAVRPKDDPRSEWFVVTTAQGKMIGRSNTPAKDAIVEYRPYDQRYKVISVGSNQYNLEAVQ